MNIFGLLRKTTQKNKKSSSLDLRKTQSSPVIIIRNTPANLKPILTNHSNVAPPSPSSNEQLTDPKTANMKRSTQITSTSTTIIEEDEDEATATTVNKSASSDSPPASSTSSSSSSFSNDEIQQERKRQQEALDKQETEALAERLREISADDMEVLLSMETQARMDHQAEQRERQQQQINEDQKRRQQQDHHQQTKRLKFALPETPSREPTPAPSVPAAVPVEEDHHHHHQYTPIAKRWSLPEEAIRQDMKKKSKLTTSALTSSKWTRYLLHPGKSDPASVHPSSGGGIDHPSTTTTATTTSIDISRRTELHYGCKVKLIRSPIKTTAYVRYIGPVHFAPGEWIGVELERAVGKTDGSVDGQRYFHTGAYRGSFLTKDELMLA